jgi:hypothetical protein
MKKTNIDLNLSEYELIYDILSDSIEYSDELIESDSDLKSRVTRTKLILCKIREMLIES